MCAFTELTSAISAVLRRLPATRSCVSGVHHCRSENNAVVTASGSLAFHGSLPRCCRTAAKHHRHLFACSSLPDALPSGRGPPAACSAAWITKTTPPSRFDDGCAGWLSHASGGVRWLALFSLPLASLRG